jgi:hypothetical protein
VHGTLQYCRAAAAQRQRADDRGQGQKRRELRLPRLPAANYWRVVLATLEKLLSAPVVV